MDFSSSSSPPPPVALSAVFIVNLRGDVLIERQYRSDVTRQNINAFKTDILNVGHVRKSVKRMALSSSKTTNNAVGDVQSLPPVRVVGRVKFMFIRVANVYVCAATKLNVNVSMCFAFLKSAIGTFQVRKEWFCCRRTRKRERKKMTFFSHSARTLKGSKRRFYVYDASREESYAASLLFFPRDILSRVFVDVSLRAPPRGKED